MKIKLQTILFLFFLFPIGNIQAAHIIGGDLTYRCLGNGDYRIYLKVYRDCQASNAAEFDGSVNGRMSIYNGSDLLTEFDKIIMPNPEISLINPNLNNPCLILPSNVCVEQGDYQFNLSAANVGAIELPLSTESYYIIYQRCCRNNSISNLINPGGTGATFFVEITPDAQSLCNNAPAFNSFPPIVVCVNEELVFDHSATDADGDLLVYELCSPITGGSSNAPNPDPDAPPPYDNVTFVAPTYGPLDPIGGDPPLSINPTTGILTGTPDAEGQYVVGICVKEYRNGILLSTIQRDFQFNVAFCEPTVAATVDGDYFIQSDSVFQFNNCAGDTTLNFTGPISPMITDYLWEFDLGGLNPLSLNQQSIDVTFPGYGIYEGLLILNPGTDCGDTAVINVEISVPPIVDYSFDYDTCVAGPVTYADLSVGVDSDIALWFWDFGDNGISTEANPIYSYTDPGIYSVSLIVTDENGCTNELIQEVTWLPVPPLIVIEPSSFKGCQPLDIFFNNLSTPIDDTYEITWDFGDGGIGTDISPSYTYNEPGEYTIHVEITSPIGCYTDRLFPNLIKVDSFPEADFYFGPDRITNFKPEVNFFDNSIRDYKWEWDFAGQGFSYEENPTFSFPDTGLQIVELIVTTVEGCQDTIQKIVDVIPEVRYFLPNAFTPNDDTVNDEFKGVGYYRGMRDYTFQVWNRYGELVFETRDPDEGWNGRKYNGGGIMPLGVYVCQVSYRSPRGVQQEVQGFITLIK